MKPDPDGPEAFAGTLADGIDRLPAMGQIYADVGFWRLYRYFRLADPPLRAALESWRLVRFGRKSVR
jgi:hypothetical protein